MKRKCLTSAMILITAIAVLIASAPAFAQSLWSDRSSLFTDQKAMGVGDVVMVRVDENFDDSDEGKVTNNKSSNDNVGSGFGILNFIRTFGLNSSSQMSSNTKVERTKELSGTISCIVTEVLPNGNFVIEGDRYLRGGAEKMKVTFTGVCRPMDIAHNNTIMSSRVANAEIHVAGKGIISRTQRPGIITQIIQSIF